MAVKKGNTGITKTERAAADVRTLAVKLLKKISGLNDTARQDVRKSRDLIVAALELMT